MHNSKTQDLHDTDNEKAICVKIDALNRLAEQTALSDADDALNTCTQAIDLTRELDQNLPQSRKKLAECYAVTGCAYRSKGRLDTAMDYLSRSLSIFEEIGSQERIGELHATMGMVLLTTGDITEGFHHLMLGLERIRKNPEPYSEALCLNNIGYGYLLFEEYGKSLEYLLQSERTAECIHNDVLQGKIRTNIAEAYAGIGEYNKSIPYAEQALHYCLKIRDHDSIVENYCIIGEANLHNKRPDVALLWYEKAHSAAQESGYNSKLPRVLNLLCRCHLIIKGAVGEIDALQRQAIETARRHNDGKQLVRSFEILCEVYERRSDIDAALLSYKQLMQSKDDIFQRKIRMRMQTLEMVHTMEAVHTGSEVNYIKNIKLKREIKRRQQIQKILENLAITDSLTGIYSRRYFFTLAERLFLQMKRYNRSMTVVMADLDHFKNINDTYGHLCGDRVLRHVAFLLKSNLRCVDLLGRYGGEEFIILMPETNRSHSSAAVERLRKKISESVLKTNKGDRMAITASFGVAEYSKEIDISIDHFFERADRALFFAKTKGRDRVEYYDGTLGSFT